MSVSRLRRAGPEGQPPVDTFGANLITRESDGKEKYDTKSLKATAKNGKLRIERAAS